MSRSRSEARNEPSRWWSSYLRLGAWLFSGCWLLEFGICALQQRRNAHQPLAILQGGLEPWRLLRTRLKAAPMLCIITRLVKCGLLLAWFLLLAGCSRRDTALSQQIVGTWTRESFEITLSADGSFVSQWTRPTSSLTYQGTWRLQDSSVVSTTVTNCTAQGTTNFQAVGSVDRWVIIRANRSDLVWSNSGQTISLKRK